MNVYISLAQIATVVLLLCAGTAQAADGNKLLSECQAAERAWDKEEESDQFAIGHCIGVIQGVKDTLTLFEENIEPAFRVCWPKQNGNIGIRAHQALRIVLSYLRENPADLHNRDVFLVIKAFKSAYPCKGAP